MPNITIAAAGLILGFLVATAYGAGFHVIVGGPARHIPLYLGASWVGFAVGHFAGDYLDIELFRLGAIHLLTASLGSWIGLISSRWLAK
ncbi:MAG: hypothetical protein OT477_13895 [Chloroflexi bacterium]|nr:hypothetical protein [Chloroflexota bacterium]